MGLKVILYKFTVLLVVIILSSAAFAQDQSINTLTSMEAQTSPTIDGLLGASEWPDVPALDSWFNYSNSGGGDETHQLKVYIQNDAINLYVAIIIMDEDFNITDSYDKLNLYFDNNNNGLLDTTEDVKVFQSLDYSDWFFHEDGYTTTDSTTNGIGKATHTTQGDNGDYIYEYEIPLNSGDTQDISVNAGDTLGLLISFTEFSGTVNTGSFGVGWDTWPLDSFSTSAFDSYGDLILAESTIVSTTTTPTTSETSTSSTGSPSNEGTTTNNISSTEDSTDVGFVPFMTLPIVFSCLIIIIKGKRLTKF